MPKRSSNVIPASKRKERKVKMLLSMVPLERAGQVTNLIWVREVDKARKKSLNERVVSKLSKVSKK